MCSCTLVVLLWWTVCVPSEPEEREEDVVSDRDLAVIARDYLDDWENLHSFLGLSRVQKREIANSYPRDYGKQKQECLEVWKEVMGPEATYSALISAAEDAKHKNMAMSEHTHYTYARIHSSRFINPQRACAARVTVLGSVVCLSVCVCVC